MTRGALLVGVVIALAAAACGDDTPTAPSDTTTTPPFTTPVTATFTGVIGPGGTLSRSFTAQLPGTARAVVSGITPATALSLGLGIPRPDGAGCLLAYSTVSGNLSAAEIAAVVDAGVFCMQVYAPAATAETVRFEVSLTHP
jgi:hypothetical protein